MKRMLAVLAVVVAAAVAQKVMADVIWVDNKLDDYTGHDGTTPALAYRTIQEAVKEAGNNDEVRVRRGTYGADQGAVTLDSGALTRVFISNKTINLFAEEADDPSLTVIEGAYASEQSPIGDGAVRCITANTASGTVIKGFTLAKGSTKTSDATATGKGGGFFDENEGRSVDLVDCVIRNCSGGRGAAAYGGQLVRTLVAENTNPVPESIIRACALFNCVVTRNTGLYALGRSYAIIGCTIYGNVISGRVFNQINSTVYNTYIAANANQTIANSTYIGSIDKSCVTATTKSGDAAKVKLLKSPMVGDYRPLANTVMTTTADSTYLSNVPEAYRATDFYGKPRLPEGAVLSVGAVQEAVATVGGRVDFASACSVNGAEPVGYAADCNYYYCEAFPQALRVKAVSETPVFQYATTANATQFPDLDDSVVIIPTGVDVFSVTPVFATQVLYVSPTGSGEKNGSSAENAFATLQDAVDAAGTEASDYTVIRAAAGDYTTDGSDAVGGQDARVVLSSQIRLVGAGATASAICGESGSETGGSGEGAVRCVAFGTANAAVQGFTLTNGHVKVDAKADNGEGGAVYSAGADTGVVLDCHLRNCVGSRGGAVYGGTYYRCLLTGNRILATGNGIAWSARFVSSVFTNNMRDKNPIGVLGQNSIAYSCSIDGDAADNPSWTPLYRYTKLYNSVMVNGGTPSADVSEVCGSVLWNFKTYPTGTDLMTDKDPLLVDSADGDFRPFPGSPVFGAGRTTASSYFKYASSDFEGQLPTFSADGYPTAGAFQDPASVVFIFGKRLNKRLVITGGEVGTNVLNRGEQITISVQPAYRDLFKCFVVNGVEPTTVTDTWTFTAPLFGSAGLQTLEPKFDPSGLIMVVR